MLNDIGDVFEAVCAIANVNTPQSAEAREKIGLSSQDARLIMSHMGVLAESCGLLLTRFDLKEPEVVRLLGMQQHLPEPKKRDQREQQGDQRLRQVEPVSHNKIFPLTQDFRLSRVTFHDAEDRKRGRPHSESSWRAASGDDDDDLWEKPTCWDATEPRSWDEK